MVERGRITIQPLKQPQWPAAPARLPEGQDRVPTRDANPGMSGVVGQNRVVVPAGARLQLRHRSRGGAWSEWGSVAGDELEFRMVAEREEKPKV